MFRNLKAHAKWMSPLVVIVLGAGMFFAAPHGAAAQASAPQRNPSARTVAPSGAKAASAAPQQSKGAAKSIPQSGDAATREQILASAAWHDTLRQFDEWLAGQTLYDAEQVKIIRLRLEAGIKRMSAAQMQRFLIAMNAKLEVLKSDHTRKAQEYFAETLAVASPAYARRVRQQLPDVLSMNAAQINQKLTAIAAKRQSTAHMQKTFDYARQQQIAFNEAQTRARERDQREQAAERASSASNSAQPNNFTPAAEYYPYSDDAFDTGYDGYAGVTWTIGSSRFSAPTARRDQAMRDSQRPLGGALSRTLAKLAAQLSTWAARERPFQQNAVNRSAPSSPAACACCVPTPAASWGSA